MLRRLLCTSTALICLLGQAVFGRNVFITPNDPQSNQLATVNAEPFSFGAVVTTVFGPNGVFAVPNAQSPGTLKYYVTGSGTADNLAVLTGRFPNLTESRRIPVSTSITSAELSPDGRFFVVAGPGGTAIVNTSTDTLSATAGSIDTGLSPVDVAFSVDSRYAYVLSASSSRVTAIDLTNNSVARTAQLPSTATAIVVSPTGVVYVSSNNQIAELDPNTLATRALIAVNGNPEALQFTPNGRYAVARNLVTFSGRSLIAVDLQTRKPLDTPVSAAFTNFALVGDDVGFALLAGGNVVEVRIGSDGTISQSAPTVSNGNIPTNVVDIVPTGEYPRSRSVVLVSSGQAWILNASTRDITGPVNVGVTGNGFSTLPVATGAVSGLLQYNTTQTAPAGSTSLPLSVVAYDTSGLPLSGVGVNFSTTASGITFANASTATNMMGLAAASVVIPAGRTGSIPVTATFANNRTATFTVNIGDPGLPGGSTGGTGTNKFTIVSGQGAVVRAGFPTGVDSEALQVRYTTANGSAITNATISWTLLDAVGGTLIVNGGVSCGSDSNTRCNLTEGDGLAVANLSTGTLPSALIPYRRYQVTATAPDGQTLTFYVVAVRTERTIGGIQVAATTANNSLITARTGEVLLGILNYRINSQIDSVAVPSVGLTVTTDNQDPALGPVAGCRGGTVFSDDLGNITCDLVISGRTGTTNLHANIGGGKVLYDYQLTVTVGQPAAVRVISGNNQTVGAGQPVSFTVQVVDAAGNALSNVFVDWNIPQNAAIVSSQNTTDANGRATLTVSLPSIAGTYFIRASANGISATLTATVTAVAGNLTVVSGDAQSAIVGQQFGQPLQVRVVDGSSNALQGVTVSFVVASGSATLGTQSATTNAQGIATTTVTAGSTAGPIVIAASTGIYRVNFNLSSRLAGPVFTADSVVNGASFQPGISPGSIAYLRVGGIAPNLRGSILPTNLVGPRPTTLADVQVIVGGIAAPIFSVSNINGEESVAFQVPFEVPVGSTNITVQSAGGGSTTVGGIQVNQLSPGVFTWVDPSNNQTYGVAVRPDGSFVSAVNPARRGEIVRIYATGLGQTSPATATNRVGTTGQSVASALIVGVNNAGARLVSAELMPGSVGVYVVALEIAGDATPGSNQPIGLAVVRSDGGAEYANSVFIPIQ